LFYVLAEFRRRHGIYALGAMAIVMIGGTLNAPGKQPCDRIELSEALLTVRSRAMRPLKGGVSSSFNDAE
jgi:hypothetical protein